MTESSDSTSLTVPSGLREKGQLDARFDITFEHTIPAATAVLTRYFTALSHRDLDAMAATLHYPFATFESADVVTVDSPGALLQSPPPSMDVRPGSTHVQAGSYDLLDSMTVHLFSPTGVAFSLTYTRFDRRGNRILRSEGVYGVTNNDGTWGIELVSTIVTPDAAIGVEYADGIEAAKRRSRDWMLGYTRRDQDLLNSTHQIGTRAHLGLANPRVNTKSARGGDPLAGYQIAGVHSRLRVTETTPESVAAMDANFPEFAEFAGGAVGQWEYTLSLPEFTILHSGPDKVHSLGGYVRYTADSRLTSRTQSISIATYRNNVWGNTGGIGVMMYHDRSNSDLD